MVGGLAFFTCYLGQTVLGVIQPTIAAQFVITGYIVYIATYFQHVLGYGPFLAALAIVPSMVAEAAFDVIAGRATDRVGARTPALFGYLLTTACWPGSPSSLTTRATLCCSPG